MCRNDRIASNFKNFQKKSVSHKKVNGKWEMKTVSNIARNVETAVSSSLAGSSTSGTMVRGTAGTVGPDGYRNGFGQVWRVPRINHQRPPPFDLARWRQENPYNTSELDEILTRRIDGSIRRHRVNIPGQVANPGRPLGF
jgi:hypothetical protein